MKLFEYTFKYSANQYNKIKNEYPFNLRIRENDIFDLLVTGETVDDISKKIGYSPRTIQRRRKDLYYGIQHFLCNDKPSKDSNCSHNNDYTKPNWKVYILIFPNDRVYIGQSLDPKTRWNNGDGYKENKEMYNDIKKYGWKNIKKRVLYVGLSYEQALEKEKELIINYKSNLSKFGYNKEF